MGQNNTAKAINITQYLITCFDFKKHPPFLHASRQFPRHSPPQIF
jgi:hypothetical protein